MVNLTQNQEVWLASDLLDLQDKALEYADEAISKNTKQIYKFSESHFENWCKKYGLVHLPATPKTVVLYITYLSRKRKYSTINKYLSAISRMHKEKRLPNPVLDYHVRTTMSGMKKKTNYKPNQKEAITLPVLKQMIDAIDDKSIIGLRDKVVLLLGFSLATRRGEFTRIEVKDIKFVEEGVIIEIYDSKTDQFIKKAVKRIGGKYCPVETLENWLINSGIKDGYVLRSFKKGNIIKLKKISDNTVNKIVKEYISKIGLNPDKYGGHSLRSGLVTSSGKAGKNDQAIMQQTGHKSRKMVDIYTQEGRIFENNVTDILNFLKEN